MRLRQANKGRKRALVTGGAASDIPVVRRLRELGWTVFTGGVDQNGPAHRWSTDYLYFDYSNFAEVTGAAKKLRATCVIPSGHDRAVFPAALAAESLGLPGHDSPQVALTLHRKDYLSAQLKRLGIPSPRNFEQSEAVEFLEAGGRVIVKPTGLAGGRGISVASRAHELGSAIGLAQESSGELNIVIQEFIEGSNHGVSLMVIGGACHVIFSDDEYFGRNRFRVAGAHSKSALTAGQLGHIRSLMQILADDLKLVDGLLHLQIIRSGNTIHVIEVMRRIPGDGYPRLPQLASGIDFVGMFLRPYLGEQIVEEKHYWQGKNVVRHVVGARAEGRFQGIEMGSNLSQHLVESFIWAKPDDLVTDPMTWAAGALYFSAADDQFLSLLSAVRQEVHAIVGQ